MRTLHLPFLFFLLLLNVGLQNDLSAQEAAQQQADHSYQPLIVKLSDDGQKYIRFLMWHQVWMTSNNMAAEGSEFSMTTSIRRSRFIAFAQVSPKFLILTHFGLNGLEARNLNTLGNQGDGPQLFLHGAWVEYKVTDFLHMGAGLHYWRGMNRLANSSTLNFMTMDHTRPFLGWHDLGYTSQFARHLGIYAKGEIGRFDYRLAVNEALVNNFEAGVEPKPGVVVYNAAKVAPDEAGKVIEGYVRYNFRDKESNQLPYAVGTYLGTKTVFNIGAGFFLHPNGTTEYRQDETYAFRNVRHFSVDAFLDIPAGQNGAVTAYAALMNFNYGRNWVGKWSGTGNAYYGHIGYFLKPLKLQPYVAFQLRDLEGMDETGSSFDAGINYFINGHHAKLTLEYHQILNEPAPGSGPDTKQIRIQAHIFL